MLDVGVEIIYFNFEWKKENRQCFHIGEHYEHIIAIFFGTMAQQPHWAKTAAL